MKLTIKRILCPTDMSPESNEALHYGIALARAYRAKLFVCHCLESSPLADDEGQDQIRKLFEDRIAARIDLAAAGPPDYETVVIEGDPVTAVPREAAERHVDLIVMRSRRQPYTAALLGSTAEALCRTSPCPVLVTHPREREWVGSSTGKIGLKRLLVAHDFSGDSELALGYGLSLAQEYQAELHLMHVLPPPVTPSVAQLGTDDDGAFRLAANRLKNAALGEADLWCQVTQVIRTGQPYREVLIYAEEHGIDLICMGKNGAGFGMRALFGSNVDRVLRQAPCPVLIARPLKPAGLGPAVGSAR